MNVMKNEQETIIHQAKEPSEDSPHYLGHRQRLRKRLLDSHGHALADYELIEFLLCLVLPRGDVKPLAKKIHQRFKSFSALLAAEPKELLEIKGVGESVVAAIFSIHEIMRRSLKEEARLRPLLNSFDKVVEYCQCAMANLKREELRVLFLDTKHYLIEEEFQQQGTTNHTELYPREVIKKALDLGATGIILVHNHPSGDPTPSRADIKMTLEMQEISERLGIKVLDHIIIGDNKYRSLKALGYL
jgi:DNA repair protein RadC